MTDISSMTNEQLNEALAVEFIGNDEHHATIYSMEKGRAWQPTRDLNQAVECAEKWINGQGRYRMRLEYQEDVDGWAYHAAIEHIYYADIVNIRNVNPARALSEAVLMVVRGGVD